MGLFAISSSSTSNDYKAPAMEAIEYEVVKFHVGPLNNEEDDIYSLPPSPETDAAWRNLYEGED